MPIVVNIPYSLFAHILPVTPIASNNHSKYSSDNLRPLVRDHSALRLTGVGRK